MRRLLLLASLAVALPQALAAECRLLHPVPREGDQIAWQGACRDGFGEGTGVISVSRKGKPSLTYEVTLARGEIVGEGMMRSGDGGLYAGTFRQGQPHGYGFFRTPEGDKYKGEVADGQPDGQGTWTGPDGSRYTGQWKAGRKEGHGRMEYALGGSYEGQWRHDVYHGRGVLTYAGSGRKVEGQFHEGQAPGSARPAAGAPSNERYRLRADYPRTGTNILREVATAPVPPDKSYRELTPEQQASVRSHYQALAPGDEPPYPLKGPKELYAAVHEALGRVGADGEITLLVDVGADGVAKSVTAIGAPTPELVRFASTAAMLQKYKPAICDGQPCAMKYGVQFIFDLQ